MRQLSDYVPTRDRGPAMKADRKLQDAAAGIPPRMGRRLGAMAGMEPMGQTAPASFAVPGLSALSQMRLASTRPAGSGQDLWRQLLMRRQAQSAVMP